jgi:Tfp pilus assembly protein PilO
MWASISVGTVLLGLVLTFGIMSRKAFKKIGKLESENETLKNQLKISEGRVARLVSPRPTVDELLAVSHRLSNIRPDDN